MAAILFRKVPTWEDVVAVLRDGHYIQHFDGGMCKYIDNITNAYDVLGVINDLSNTSWELLGSDSFLCDDDGETLKLSSNFVVEPLVLDGLVTAEELEGTTYGDSFFYWNSDIVENECIANRMDLLIYLNDMLQWDFPRIANEIERLGWSNG